MKKTILIVDDSKSWQVYNRTLVTELFPDKFDITLANSAVDALKIINDSKTPFDFILTDLQMELDWEPLLAGEYLIKSLKETGLHNSHIIIISSMYNIEIIAKQWNVEFVSKSKLVNNNLLLKYIIENHLES